MRRDLSSQIPPSEDKVLQRMGHYIQSWESVNDQRSVFLRCYRMMTANMLSAISAGKFINDDWVRGLLGHFAEYYFDALSLYERKNNPPAVWQKVHDMTCSGTVHPLQNLLLGVNAHINYDLVLTLYDVLKAEWSDLPPQRRQCYYQDHNTVNEIIASTVDAVQDEILEPDNRVMALIDDLFGRLDEYLLSQLIRRWRQDVWEKTEEMLEAADDVCREDIRVSLESEVVRRGELLGMRI